MKIYGAEMSFGVGTEGLSESLSYFQSVYKDLAFPLVDLSDIHQDKDAPPNLKNLKAVTEACRRIFEAGEAIVEAGEIPLFVGGDHATAIATVASTVNRYPGEGLVWIDAHPDIHLPETTATGNIHGMPTAVAMGKGEAGLKAIYKHFIDPKKTVMLGLRDIDPPEALHLADWGVRFYTWETIRQRGLDEVLDETIAYLRAQQADGLHISVDIDGTDPSLLPGVSVPVAQGFLPEEPLKIADRLIGAFALRGLDAVEFNYRFDRDGRTAEWLSGFLRHYADFELGKLR